MNGAAPVPAKNDSPSSRPMTTRIGNSHHFFDCFRKQKNSPTVEVRPAPAADSKAVLSTGPSTFTTADSPAARHAAAPAAASTSPPPAPAGGAGRPGRAGGTAAPPG